jgi:hypothetical protein
MSAGKTTKFRQRQQRCYYKIQKWAEAYGAPPRAADWKGVRSEEFLEQHGNGWPSYLTVIRYSPDGTWDSAIEGAGFEARGRGRPSE